MKSPEKLWIEMSIREISTQAKFANLAFININSKTKNSNDVVFSSIHSFLSHCANISKLLKSSNSSEKNNLLVNLIKLLLRRNNKEISIGNILKVDNSIIHKRMFRNHLEHYDKELKKWINRKGPNVNIGTYNIGPKSMIKADNFIFVSHYDPTTTEFTSIDKEINLREMHIESQRIKALADNWITNSR